MYLVFSKDSEQDNFLIGVISGQKAEAVAAWLVANPSGNKIITGVPIISFSSEVSNNRDDQTAIWRIGSLHLITETESKWTWGPTASRLPPRLQRVKRSYKLGMARGSAYFCRGMATGGFPLLTTLSATPGGTYYMADAHMVCIVPVPVNTPGNTNIVAREKRGRSPSPPPGPSKERRI